MKRNGKIAHLSNSIREQLNARLYQEHTGPEILKWLNALPEVRTAMAKHFGGRPISQQNLSEWRQGGYHEWHDKFTTGPSLIQSDPAFRRHYLSLLRGCYEAALSQVLHEIFDPILSPTNKNQPEPAFPQGNSSHN